MKLKDLKNDDFNILDFITFFDDIPDTEPYFAEMVLKFGERELLSKVEDSFLASGLGGIGMAFDLKYTDWQNLANLSNEVISNVMGKSTVTKTTDKTDTVEKAGTNSSDVVDDDFIVAYDEELDTKQSGSSKTNTTENVESLTNEQTGTDTTVKTGYDRQRMGSFMFTFNNYPDYRMRIYNDIVDSLCIKGYN